MPASTAAFKISSRFLYPNLLCAASNDNSTDSTEQRARAVFECINKKGD